MNQDNEFINRLDAIVDAVPVEGRAQVEGLISSVIEAGGTSDSALLEMLQDQNLNLSLRLDICWLVSRLEIAEAKGVLQELLSDPSEGIRAEAAIGLGLISKGHSVDLLLKSLEQESSMMVRQAILHALGIVSSPASVPAIISVLKNQDETAEVRADAAEALAHIKAEPIVDVLIEALKDNSPLVRYSAAYSLGEQQNDKAIPALNEVVLQDRSKTPWGSVADCAQNAIELIRQAKLD